MRTYRDLDKWIGVWIAGFAGINLFNDKRRYLFYLMKVKRAYKSHKEIWYSLSPQTRDAKNAFFHLMYGSLLLFFFGSSFANPSFNRNL